MSHLSRITVGSLAVILAIGFVYTPPVRAQLFDTAMDRLTGIERDSLRKGKTIVAGEKGNYVARTLVTAPMDVAWKVLTDYERLPSFIPNLLVSKVLERKENRLVVEQVNSRQVMFVVVQTRLKLEISENDRKQISFKMLEGDLASFEGSWTIDPVSPIPGKPPTQVLITQRLEAQPNTSVPLKTFYEVFKDSLAANMDAVGKEITRRNQPHNALVEPLKP